jgi:hypothetical protein
MRIEKIVLEKSAERLLDKAEDCFDLAKIQKDEAGEQHKDADVLDASATKLIALGNSLEADAVEIKGDTLVVQRGNG